MKQIANRLYWLLFNMRTRKTVIFSKRRRQFIIDQFASVSVCVCICVHACVCVCPTTCCWPFCNRTSFFSFSQLNLKDCTLKPPSRLCAWSICNVSLYLLFSVTSWSHGQSGLMLCRRVLQPAGYTQIQHKPVRQSNVTITLLIGVYHYLDLLNLMQLKTVGRIEKVLLAQIETT